MNDIKYRVKLEDTACFNEEFNDSGKIFDRFEDAEKFCYEKHDSGFYGDMVIEDTKYDRPLYLHAHELEQVECPACGKTYRVMDMMRTYDCHGIPYRKVCPKCYHRIMDEVGYDGEYYTEADECIDYDY